MSNNQLLFGVLESLFLLSFSRYVGAAKGSLGAQNLEGQRPSANSDFGPGEYVKIDTSLQRNAIPGLPGGDMLGGM